MTNWKDGRGTTKADAPYNGLLLIQVKVHENIRFLIFNCVSGHPDAEFEWKSKLYALVTFPRMGDLKPENMTQHLTKEEIIEILDIIDEQILEQVHNSSMMSADSSSRSDAPIIQAGTIYQPKPTLIQYKHNEHDDWLQNFHIWRNDLRSAGLMEYLSDLTAVLPADVRQFVMRNATDSSIDAAITAIVQKKHGHAESMLFVIMSAFMLYRKSHKTDLSGHFSEVTNIRKKVEGLFSKKADEASKLNFSQSAIEPAQSFMLTPDAKASKVDAKMPEYVLPSEFWGFYSVFTLGLDPNSEEAKMVRSMIRGDWKFANVKSMLSNFYSTVSSSATPANENTHYAGRKGDKGRGKSFDKKPLCRHGIKCFIKGCSRKFFHPNGSGFQQSGYKPKSDVDANAAKTGAPSASATDGTVADAKTGENPM